MNPFVHVHSSSRYDRTPQGLSVAVDRYCKEADIVTLTEVSANKRERALIKIGFGLVCSDKGGGDDCAILYRRTRFSLVHRETFLMYEGRYAQIVVLRDRLANVNIVFASVHYPAHVETALARGTKTSQAIAWTRCVWALKRRVNRLKRKFKAVAAFISADWNVNIKRKWVQTLLKTIHPAYRISWRAPFPEAGTHGYRLIDAVLFKGDVSLYEESRLLKDDDSSDHRPFRDSFKLAA